MLWIKNYKRELIDSYYFNKQAFDANAELMIDCRTSHFSFNKGSLEDWDAS
jgi:hypothetical protein